MESGNWWTVTESLEDDRNFSDETSGYVSGYKNLEVPVNLTMDKLHIDPMYTSPHRRKTYTAWSSYSKGGISTASSTKMPETTFLHNNYDQNKKSITPPKDYVVPLSRYRPNDAFENSINFFLKEKIPQVYSLGVAPLESPNGVGNVSLQHNFPNNAHQNKQSAYWDDNESTSSSSTVDVGSNNGEYGAQHYQYFPKPVTQMKERGACAYFPKPAGSKRDVEMTGNVNGVDGGGDMLSFINNLNKGTYSRTSTPLPNDQKNAYHFEFDEQKNEDMVEKLRNLVADFPNSTKNYVKMTVKSARVFDIDPWTTAEVFTTPLENIESVGDVKITTNVTNRVHNQQNDNAQNIQSTALPRRYIPPGKTLVTRDEMTRFQNSPICKFCFKNGEPAEVYLTHITKMADGTVTCPVLQKYVCEICGATGTASHTRSYCPKNPDGASSRKTPSYKRLPSGLLSSIFNQK